MANGKWQMQWQVVNSKLVSPRRQVDSGSRAAICGRRPALAILLASVWLLAVGQTPDRDRLRHPDDAFWRQAAPAVSHVVLDTSTGIVVLEMRRAWAPHGVDRFYNLVRGGYYDDARIFRIRKATWAQFGVNGDPAIARAWRNAIIPDDPRVESNVRGTVAYAFKN